VILRKISLGSQSTWGARLVERLMTVAVTCNKNGFEKVKNGRPSGGLLVTKKEGYRFIPLPP